MMGDGVNDVPALKVCDCAIAMAGGSDAARKVSQVVLMKENFSALPSIILEGRRVINNITRSASLFLVKTCFSYLLSLLMLLLPWSYPFHPIQLTLISTFTVGIPSFFLALEPNKERVQAGFLQTILRHALPGALTNLVLLILVFLLSGPLQLSADMRSTIAVGAAGMTGLMVLHPGLQDIVQPEDQLIFLKSPRDMLGAAWLPGALAPMGLKALGPHRKEKIGRILVLGTQGRERFLHMVEQSGETPVIDTQDEYDVPLMEEKIAAGGYDMVLCLHVAGQQDSHIMPHLLLLHELLAGQDCYLCAVLADNDNARYVYAHRIVDLVLKDDRERLIASDILAEDSPLQAVEQELFFGEKGLRLLPAKETTGGEAVKISALASALAQQGMLLLGFVHRLGENQVILNPNKNETILFDDHDDLIVV